MIFLEPPFDFLHGKLVGRRWSSLHRGARKAREDFLKHLDQLFQEKNEGQFRLLNIVQGAEPYTVKSKLRAIVDHFGLKWESDMELIFNVWKRFRNPVIHYGKYASRSEDEIKATTIAESQIAGGINILSLKLFGYSGYMQSSVFEDAFRQV